MMKSFWLVLMLFVLSYPVFADEIDDKTDGSFVGTRIKTVKSSFMGSDESNSRVNYSFAGKDVEKKTDRAFVGKDTIKHDDVYFAGDTYKQEVQRGRVPAFAQEHSDKDIVNDVFEGEDVDKKTDGFFVGGNYGK